MTPSPRDHDLLDASAVPEARARRDCLFGEVGVEPPALRHQDQRLAARAAETPVVVEPQLERVDDALDDRADVARRLPQRPAREAAAARLVAREARPVGEQHARPAAGEVDRSRRPRRPGTDDEDVEALHRASMHGRRAATT